MRSCGRSFRDHCRLMGLLGPTAVHTLLIQCDPGQPVGYAGSFVKTSVRNDTGGGKYSQRVYIVPTQIQKKRILENQWGV